MKVPKLWFAALGAGLAVTFAGVLMSFLADHHWYISYGTLLLFERWLWPTLLAGVSLSLAGCVGVSVKIPERAALLVGIGSLAIGLVLPFFLQVADAAINVHSWTAAFVAPILVVFGGGTIFTASSLLRLLLRHRRQGRAAPVRNS